MHHNADGGIVVDVDVRPGASGDVAVASSGAVDVYGPEPNAALACSISTG